MFSVASSGSVRSHRVFAYLGALWILFGVLLLVLNWINPSVRITWTTETEVDTAGFNVYRAASIDGSCDNVEGEYILLNDELIPSSNDPISGGDYSFVDDDVVAYQSYCYQLEDIEFSQSSTRHDPILGGAEVGLVSMVFSGLSILIGIGLIIVSLRMEKNI